jgi:two-component system, NarL family, response regulator DevR
MVKLFIADDNKAFRKRLASVLAGIEGIEIAGQAGEVSEAIKSIDRTAPDVIILDIHMPGGSGLDILKTVKSALHPPLVMMLTVGPGTEYREKCLAMGADYFFEKSSDLKKIMMILAKMVKRAEHPNLKKNNTN